MAQQCFDKESKQMMSHNYTPVDASCSIMQAACCLTRGTRPPHVQHQSNWTCQPPEATDHHLTTIITAAWTVCPACSTQERSASFSCVTGVTSMNIQTIAAYWVWLLLLLLLLLLLRVALHWAAAAAAAAAQGGAPAASRCSCSCCCCCCLGWHFNQWAAAAVEACR
jgi:hypothetical protein